ncbi:MAG: acetyl-CoA carboxylase biotin carboxyl carrier protein [Kyrpidia sp.]|nr:acetyl-CoA carboxylase biotin carboxyl carrier protein [Kyrpidia sp.]
MFRVTEIRELIRLMDETSVVELEVESEGSRLSIRKAHATGVAPAVQAAPPAAVQAAVQQPAASTPAVPAGIEGPPAPAAAPLTGEKRGKGGGEARSTAIAEASLHTITSPMVGTFYRAPAPDADPYVQIGSKVTEKTIVCIVEAMKLMNEIEADCRGEIVEVLAENGQLVEFGQPLFRVRLD